MLNSQRSVLRNAEWAAEEACAMMKMWAVFNGNTLVSRHWTATEARAATGTAAEHVRYWRYGSFLSRVGGGWEFAAPV